MKVLLIGMDGAHIDVFKRGWTPFISSLIEEGNQLNIKNDLLSRGWLEIATGEHASKTGAMYDNPKMNGTHEWNLKFSIHDIPMLGSNIKPIWQRLNENGYKVGVMNLPTVFPSPKIDGFFVSGGGGGAPVVEKAIPELCYPTEILEILTKNDYIVDERTVQLVVDKKLHTPDLIMSELANKNSKRTKSFIELANKYNIDFGFIVYKTSSVTAETIVAPEWKKVINNDSTVDTQTIDALKSYYNKFDTEIKKLKKAFPDTEIIFTADHGTVARTYSVNLNIFLQNNQFQQPANTSKNLKKTMIEKLKKIIPFSLKVKLQKFSSIKQAVDTVVNFNNINSVAFTHTKNDWNHGIYINDKDRFGGPVEAKDIQKTKEEIIKAFNSNKEVQNHKLRAYSIKENIDNPIEFFPDICIDMPSGYVTNNAVNKFIEAFKRPEGISSLSSILRGDMISLKSHEPLAVDCGDFTEEDKKLYNGRNLTAIYDLVLHKFNIQREK